MTHLGRLTFVVDGEPIAKGRARSTRSGHHYTPAKTRSAEQRIAMIAKKALETSAFKLAPGAAIAADMSFLFKRPKSGPNAKKPLGSPCTKKPDWDNLAKLVMDALNGVCYVDDAFVTAGHVTKAWADVPSTIVTIWRIE